MSPVRILEADLPAVGAEALCRSVRNDGASLTAVGRRVELSAGPGVGRHLEALAPLATGSAVLTPGGGLPAPYLLHLVIQSPDEPVSEELVRRALTDALARAADWGIGSLALPPVGTGAGNLDAESVARLLASILLAHESAGRDPRDVILVVETEYEMESFTRALADVGLAAP